MRFCEASRGANAEARQALMLLPFHCQNEQMSEGAVLDLSLVQTRSGLIELFSPPGNSTWGRRVTKILDNIRTDFHQQNFHYLPRIEQDPALKHLSVDVTTHPRDEMGRAQA